MQRKATPQADIVLSVFLIVVCAAVLWESRKIPPGTFEPMGSAPVPQAVAGLIIVLCLVVILKAILQLRTGNTDDANNDEADEALILRPLDAAAVLVLTIIYCLILEFRLLSFAVATILFLTVTISLLTRLQPRLLPLTIIIAVIMGYGCQYLFTQVFVVDLPGI